MQSRKMSQALRETIWVNLKKDILQPKYDTLFNELCDIGTELYKNIIGSVHLELIEKLPEHYITRSAKVKLDIPGNSWFSIVLSKSMPIPSAYVYGAISYNEFWNKDECDKWLKKYNDKKKEITAWEAHIKECYDYAMQIMNSVTTTKQLITLWPECEKYLPNANKNVDTAQLPMVQVTKLNAMLGIKGA